MSIARFLGLLICMYYFTACQTQKYHDLPLLVTPKESPTDADIQNALEHIKTFHAIIFQEENKQQAKFLAQQACILGLGEGCLFSVFNEPIHEDAPQSAAIMSQEFLTQQQSIINAQTEMDKYALQRGMINCQNNIGSECAIVGGIYERGDGVEIDENKALEFYDKACRLNSAQGCLAQSRFTRYSHQLFDKTFILLEHACADDDPFLCYMLGEWSVIAALRNKQTSPTSSFLQDAKAYYEKACNLGFDPESLGLQGSCTDGNVWESRLEIIQNKQPQ